MNYSFLLTVITCCIYTIKGSEEFTNTELTDDTNGESYSRVRRGGFSMLRLGRGLQMLRLGKRSLPMLRLGRSAGDPLSEDEVQYLLSLMRNDRQVPLPRYGKDLAFQYLLMKALKNAEMNSGYDDMEQGYGFGYDLEATPERQIRPAPRPGRYRRSTDDDQQHAYVGATQVYDDNTDDNVDNNDEKFVRVAPLMRYGKAPIDYDFEDENDVDKRAMRMLRLGRGMRMLRLGKRPAPVDDSDITEANKRALRLLRLGKRPVTLNSLRNVGMEDDSDVTEAEKRALRLLRLGKRPMDLQTLRDEADMEADKRALRLLRLGKKSVTDESS
ncbi:hypothetical protein ACF0H5_015412 [Mactra antiquata]